MNGEGKESNTKLEAVLKRNDGKSEEGFELNRKFSGWRRWEGGGIKETEKQRGGGYQRNNVLRKEGKRKSFSI